MVLDGLVESWQNAVNTLFSFIGGTGNAAFGGFFGSFFDGLFMFVIKVTAFGLAVWFIATEVL